MDNIRLVLIASLAFVTLFLWQAWQDDYGQKPIETTQQTAVGSTPTETATENKDLPTPVNTDVPTNLSQPDITTAEPSKKGKRITVETDIFTAVIDTQGGDIRRVLLDEYPVSLENPDIPLVLLNDTNGQYYINQGGFLSDQEAPNHHSIYSTTADNYTLEEGKDTVDVVLNWSEEGIEASKIFKFHRDSYLIDITYRIKNNSDQPWQGRVYEQLQRQHSKEGMSALPTYTGAAVSTPELRYEKLEFDDMREEPLSIDSKDGWLAMVQHYFVSAILPGDEQQHYYTKALGNERYLIGTYGPTIQVNPGETQERTVQLYSGPKIQKDLAALAPNLELTKDYGVLWFLAKPIFQVMDFIHDIIGNWGWSIILVTVLIKAIFYPLSAMGYKSMAKMRKVQPRMMQLKERYGDDKQKMQKAMMELYKEEKINPLGGCFPILVQIPVFLALYWVLLESVEIRQAPFMLWIQDLSVADPFFVLPVLMGISMYVQQKLNPTPPDPMQAKIMQMLPFIFTVFFAFFPAGLVLYWVANNILSIAQQWMITRQIEGPKKPA